MSYNPLHLLTVLHREHKNPVGSVNIAFQCIMFMPNVFLFFLSPLDCVYIESRRSNTPYFICSIQDFKLVSTGFSILFLSHCISVSCLWSVAQLFWSAQADMQWWLGSTHCMLVSAHCKLVYAKLQHFVMIWMILFSVLFSFWLFEGDGVVSGGLLGNWLKYKPVSQSGTINCCLWVLLKQFIVLMKAAITIFLLIDFLLQTQLGQIRSDVQRSQHFQFKS